MQTLIETQDGSLTLKSNNFGETYHSKFGAIQESYHIFIKAGLCQKALSKKGISILEFGFGTGLNAFLTAIEASKLDLEIYYNGIEAYPIEKAIWEKLNYAQCIDNQNLLSDFFQKIHDCSWGKQVVLTEKFTLEKTNTHFEKFETDLKFDIIYFDAFSPEAQPELWSPNMMQKAFNFLNSEGILVTYCAKGELKRTLKNIGFKVETLEGPPGKREMIRAVKS